MRHGSAIGVGLGLLVVLPSLAAPQTAADLQRALGETLRALEVLGGLEQSLPKLPPEHAVELVRSATEAPSGVLAEERMRDERLQELRKSVGRLQMAHDELVRASSAPHGETASTAAPVAPLATQALAQGSAQVSTGIDDSLRAAMSREPSIPVVRAARASASSSISAAAVQGTPDDRVRQGQALYRGEKYADALTVLRGVEGDPRAKYWSARSLERLERFDEAVALYKEVAADPTAEYLTTRAKSDVEFLEWKREFTSKVEARGAMKSTPAKPAAATDAKPNANKEPR